MTIMSGRAFLTAFLLVCTGPLSLGAKQAGREQIDLSLRGPQVGETIPQFALEDQYGRTWTRESVLGRNGTMLVFLRSADW